MDIHISPIYIRTFKTFISFVVQLVDLWLSLIFLQENRTDMIKTGAEDTLASHLLVFAAEKARRENRVITINPDGTFWAPYKA